MVIRPKDGDRATMSWISSGSSVAGWNSLSCMTSSSISFGLFRYVVCFCIYSSACCLCVKLAIHYEFQSVTEELAEICSVVGPVSVWPAEKQMIISFNILFNLFRNVMQKCLWYSWHVHSFQRHCLLTAVECNGYWIYPFRMLAFGSVYDADAKSVFNRIASIMKGLSLGGTIIILIGKCWQYGVPSESIAALMCAERFLATLMCLKQTMHPVWQHYGHLKLNSRNLKHNLMQLWIHYYIIHF